MLQSCRRTGVQHSEAGRPRAPRFFYGTAVHTPSPGFLLLWYARSHVPAVAVCTHTPKRGISLTRGSCRVGCTYPPWANGSLVPHGRQTRCALLTTCGQILVTHLQQPFGFFVICISRHRNHLSQLCRCPSWCCSLASSSRLHANTLLHAPCPVAEHPAPV